MRKSGRVLVRISAGFVALVAAGLVWCLNGVDHRPYFREAYYTETISRLRTHNENLLVRGELSAGFGRVRLTPTVNVAADDPVQGHFRSLPLAGYGGRKGRPATGTRDELHVKAVALRVGDRVGVMIGADALIIPAEVTALAMERLQTELKLAREQVYLSATHTHCSLGGWGEGIVAESFAGGFQPGTRVWFADRLVSAVRDAIADLQPALFGHGSFDAPEFVRNRLVGELGKVDPEFSFLVVKQQSGRVGVLGSYSAHATVLSSSVMEFSGDYPGDWQRAVEAATGGMAVFLAGGVGSHSPVPGDKGHAGAERMGQALAKPVIDQLPEIPLTNAVTFGLVGIDVSLPPLNVRVSDGVRLRPWLAAKLVPADRTTFLQAFRLNDTVWISTPCDYSGELALGFKDSMRARSYRGVITSFNGDYIGYVICARYYHLEGYEPRVMSFFGPHVPDYFDEMIRAMALALINSSSGF